MLKGDLKKGVWMMRQFATREKTDVMTEELCDLEKKLDTLKTVYTTSAKKIANSLQSNSGESDDKRRKKVAEFTLANTFHDLAQVVPSETATYVVLSKCTEVLYGMTDDIVRYQKAIDERVLNELTTLTDNKISEIERKKKELKELGTKMDIAKSRYTALSKQAQQANQQYASAATPPGLDASISLPTSLSESSSTVTGASMSSSAWHGGGEDVREAQREATEAEERMERFRDELTDTMRKFCKNEAEHATALVQLLTAQLELHRNCVERLEAVIPQCTRTIQDFTPHPVYGIPLDDHLTQTGRRIAIVIDEAYRHICKYGLNEEGLFRLAASQLKLRRLKSFYDFGRSLEQDRAFEEDVHVVAGALKQYLRELPEPLLGFALYDDWVRGASLDDRERVALYRDCVRRLPPSNRENLERLVHLLLRVVQHRDRNKMTEQNLGICVGPNLLWPDPARAADDSATANAEQTGLVVQVCPVIVETLVRHFEHIFDQFPGASTPSTELDNVELTTASHSATSLPETKRLGPSVSGPAQPTPAAVNLPPQRAPQRRPPPPPQNRANAEMDRERSYSQPQHQHTIPYNAQPTAAAASNSNPFVTQSLPAAATHTSPGPGPPQTYVPDQVATAVLINFDYTSPSTAYLPSALPGSGAYQPAPAAAPSVSDSAGLSGVPSQMSNMPPPPRWAAPSNVSQKRTSEPPRQAPPPPPPSGTASYFNYPQSSNLEDGTRLALTSDPNVDYENVGSTSANDPFPQSQNTADLIDAAGWSPTKQLSAVRSVPPAPPDRRGNGGQKSIGGPTPTNAYALADNVAWPTRSMSPSHTNAAFPVSSSANWATSRHNAGVGVGVGVGGELPPQSIMYSAAMNAQPAARPSPPNQPAPPMPPSRTYAPNYRRN